MDSAVRYLASGRGLSGSRSSAPFMADLEKTEWITGPQFLSCERIEDWRPIWGGGWACAYFRTGSLLPEAA